MGEYFATLRIPRVARVFPGTDAGVFRNGQGRCVERMRELSARDAVAFWNGYGGKVRFTVGFTK